jgi:hypothetical protein
LAYLVVKFASLRELSDSVMRVTEEELTRIWKQLTARLGEQPQRICGTRSSCITKSAYINPLVLNKRAAGRTIRITHCTRF